MSVRISDWPKPTSEQLDSWLNAPAQPTPGPVVPWPILLGWETQETLKDKKNA